MEYKKLAERTLFWAVIMMFVGRAWQHLVVDAPYRSFLWNEDWWGELVPRLTGISWADWVKSDALMSFLDVWQNSVGVLFLLFAVLVFSIPSQQRIQQWVVGISTFLLFFIFVLGWQQRNYVPAMLLEHSAQLTAPLFWYCLRFDRFPLRKILVAAKIVLGLTFVSHGLYALNFYPRPGEFTQMFISTLGVTESTAIDLLNLAGVMDILLTIAIFCPPKWVRWGLIYAVFWGVMTTVARLWANVYWDFFGESLNQWMGPFLYRFPHFLLPFAAVLLNELLYLKRQ